MRFSFVVFLFSVICVSGQAQRDRCGTPEPDMSAVNFSDLADCGYLTNTPKPEHDPSFYYAIPVVFHVIMNNAGDGFLSQETIQDQIDILNEDFRAIPGSPGEPGTNARILFYLATTDPDGSATTGITYSTDNSWFNDNGGYWNSLAWDTNRYLNVYTNAVPCCFGYVSGFPSQGIAGQASDRVVLWWEAVGREPTPGWPQNMGRTATHEVGHYVGLYHTFCGGCGNDANCNGTGDLICDTNGQANFTSGCPASQSSCGSADPFHNYMDYTDDPCLWEFTPEQVNRMRCTLENWRPDVWEKSDLALGVNQNTFVGGDTLNLTTCGGEPGSLTMLVAVEVNEAPTFLRLDLGSFDAGGCRSFGGPVSGDLASIVATFQSFGFYQPAKLGFSNRATVTFQ